MSIKYFVFAICVIITVVSTNPVSFITRCNATDFNCAKESAAKAIPVLTVGVPELGIEPLDPYTYKKIDASTPSLKLIFRDFTSTGLRNCKPLKIKRDLTKKKLHLKFLCDVQSNGQYEMKGHLLILPIEGKGKAHIHLKKFLVSADLDIVEITGEDGKVHWDIKNYTHHFELKDKSELVFENLFPGNELLGRTARELVSSNSNDIILEVGPNVLNVMAKNIIGRVNEFFHKVPVEDLSIE